MQDYVQFTNFGAPERISALPVRLLADCRRQNKKL